jgi:hypothetical protein
VQPRNNQLQRLRLRSVTVLDIFSIVIQKLTNIRHDGPLIGIKSAISGVGQAYCTCFCCPEYQTRAIGCTFTGRFILRRVSAGSEAML